MYLYLPHFILLLLIHWLIGERSHFSLSNSRDDDEICLAVARSVSVSVQNPTMNFFSYAFTSRWPPSSKYNLDCSITDWTHKSTPSAPQTCKADEDDGYFHRAAHIKCSNSWNCQWHSPPPGFHGQENGIQLYPCDLWVVHTTLQRIFFDSQFNSPKWKYNLTSRTLDRRLPVIDRVFSLETWQSYALGSVFSILQVRDTKYNF